MESWLLLIDSQARATSTSTSGSGLNVSALGQLTGISGGSSSSGTKDSGVTGYQDLELMMLVTQCLDWIMTSAGEDPDIHSRVLKVEILRMASIGLQREDNHTD